MIVPPSQLEAPMLQRPSLATLLLLITLGPMAPAQSPVTFTGHVAGVLDGDSLLVLDGQRQVELRLHGVDAPEGGQAYGGVCKALYMNKGRI
jgi:micrococcal nuclease